MKKKIEKKNQRSLLTGTYQTKNKKSLSIPKKSNSKTQERTTKESKNKKFRGKSFTRNNTFGHVYESILSSIIKPNLWPL